LQWHITLAAIDSEFNVFHRTMQWHFSHHDTFLVRIFALPSHDPSTAFLIPALKDSVHSQTDTKKQDRPNSCINKLSVSQFV